MKIFKSLILIVFLSCPLISNGQSPDTLIMHKSAIFLGSEPITLREARDVMLPYNEAYGEMSKAKWNADVSTVMASVGGFLVGWQLGTELAGGEGNLASLGIGIGAAIASVAFRVMAKKRTRSAIKMYNANVKATAYMEGLNPISFSNERLWQGLIRQ